MCGFLGVLDLRGDPRRRTSSDDPEAGVLLHRGPDACGSYSDGDLVMRHRRLSIIDVAGGHQPLFNEDRSVCIAYNGEIYNYRELTRELQALGHRFETHSDTECIVHAYEEYGRDCVNRLRGMFAFAIWDKRSRTLFLARDRLGIKPLYLASHNGTYWFASEIKGILQQMDRPREIDPVALASFIDLTYIPAPWTIYKGIRKVEPGTTVEIDARGERVRRYWDLQFDPDHSTGEERFAAEIRQMLDRAVEMRLISEVPLGAFLSGGVDSGAIVGLMQGRENEPTATFTIGYGGETGGFLDERGYARQVAERYGCRHTEQEIVPRFEELIDEIVGSFDEPFADSSAIPSYYVSQTARRRVTVALSGLGGDELFGGYERHLGFALSRHYQRLPALIREGLVRRLVEALPERRDGHYTVNHLKRFVRAASLPTAPRYLTMVSTMSRRGYQGLFNNPAEWRHAFEESAAHLRSVVDDAPAEDPLDKIFYYDLKTYLPEDILACTDRMSMRHSLEVRVPFLDHELVELAARVPHALKIRRGRKKHILRRAVEDLLPPEVFRHRKQGFIGPMTKWLQHDLRPHVERVLSAERLDVHGLFSPGAVREILDEHFSGSNNNEKLIWSLFMFQEWHRRYIEHAEIPGRPAEAGGS